MSTCRVVDILFYFYDHFFTEISCICPTTFGKCWYITCIIIMKCYHRPSQYMYIFAFSLHYMYYLFDFINEDCKLTRLKVLGYDWKLMQPDQVWLQQQSWKSMQVWTLRKLTSKWRRILLPVGKSRTVPVCSLWIPDYWSLSASLVGVYSPAEGPLYHRKHKTTLPGILLKIQSNRSIEMANFSVWWLSTGL